jgi:F0F1-type ATP synthase assembly protein I
MVRSEEDDRSMIAKAWSWGYQATSISLEMVIPGIIGLWIDRLLGTVMLFLILGVVFGMTAGMIHLVQFARRIGEQKGRPKDDRDEDGPDG